MYVFSGQTKTSRILFDIIPPSVTYSTVNKNME